MFEETLKTVQECRGSHVSILLVQEVDLGSMPAASQLLPHPHVTTALSSESAPAFGAKPKSGVSQEVST